MITAGLLFAVPVIVLAVALVVAARIYASAPPRLAESKDLRQLRRARRSAIRAAQSSIRKGYGSKARTCWAQVELLELQIAKIAKRLPEAPVAVARGRGRVSPGLTQGPQVGRLGGDTPVPTKEHP